MSKRRLADQSHLDLNSGDLRFGHLFLCALCVLCGECLCLAGDLNPPPGAPAPTPGPEPRIAINATNTPGDSDSRFRIGQPGSYYLAGNATGEAAKSGIEIGASNVTIDLNGFTLQGVPGSLDGIRAGGGVIANITVRNGVVAGFGADGISLCQSGLEKGVLVESVHASGNAGTGISVPTSSIVRNCTANNNSDGINTCDHCVIESCTARENADDGITASDYSIIRGSAAVSNISSGMFAGEGSVIEACISDQNGAQGILTGFGCTVRNCTSRGNGVYGIAAGGQSNVSGCTASANTLDGINVGDNCTVLHNTCDGNGAGSGDGAGIHATGAGNHIEGNNCGHNDRGIDVDNFRNVIIRNYCFVNTTDWTIVANNNFGPIIDRRNPMTAAVNGFSAAAALGSTDPNANFSY